MNPSPSRAAEQLSLDTLIYDFTLLSCETILRDRTSNVSPVGYQFNSIMESLEYCRQTILSWRKDIHKPLGFDIFIFDSISQSSVLMERWKISFQKVKETPKDYNRHLSFISRRISTLIRTLHCFVRMLPGYNLVKTSRKVVYLSFHLYPLNETTQRQDNLVSFSHPPSLYKFTPVPTPKGLLSISVNYLNAHLLKDLIKNIQGGPNTAHSMPIPIHSRHMKEKKDDSGSIPRPVDINNISDVTLSNQKKAQGCNNTIVSRSLDSNNNSKGSSIPNNSSSSNVSSQASSASSQRRPFAVQGDPQPQASSYCSQSTQPTSSFSQSTPPFSCNIPDIVSVPEASTYLDPTAPAASPPYAFCSASLTSTSPHIAANMLALAERRNTFGRKKSYSMDRGVGMNTSTTMIAYEKSQSAPGSADEIRALFTLPASPFECLYGEQYNNANNNNSSSNSNRQSIDYSSPTGSSPVDANKQDLVLYQDATSRQRQDLSLVERKMFSVALTSSHVSNDAMVDLAQAEEDDLDDHLDALDEEMPFAWAQSDYGGQTTAVTAATSIVAFAGKGLSDKSDAASISDTAQLSLRAGASIVGSDCAVMNGVALMDAIKAKISEFETFCSQYGQNPTAGKSEF